MTDIERKIMTHVMSPMVQAWLWTRDPSLSKDDFFVDAMTNNLLSIEKEHIMNLLQVKTTMEALDYLLDQSFAETLSDAKISDLGGV